MKFGKRQITLAVLLVMIGFAAFLNWRYNGASTAPTSKNIGEATLVSGEATTDSGPSSVKDYFQNARLGRQTSRDQAIELLQGIVSSDKSTKEEIADANAKISQIADDLAAEEKVEELVRAKGFGDCVTYITGGTANIVVKAEGLTEKQAAQINEIVKEQTGIASDKVKIIETK